MRTILSIITFLSLLIVSCKNDDHAGHANDAVVITKTEPGKIDTVKKSIKAYTQNKIGAANIQIRYHSPAVRDRVIWGGLVPFDGVWVAGAHNATSIESDKDLIMDGKTIPAGKYAFFTIPGKEEWTVIVNKNWDQHLADDYKQEDDLLRMKVKPDTLNYKQERLLYEIEQSSQKEGNILLVWEKLKLTIPVRIAD
ncbi:MAG TPA: DUF2911 domain-containing protein [Chitinophagaceae bacterium]